ncbi:MAG: MBL fold metallo-hydrolase [Candidatus Poribacteria bacterium]|nr:MBL fold metallo-hydrolase [Candidatus Poribacteria bacterium]
MILESLVVSPFQSNCWILGCEETRAGVVIDPGDEAERILKVVEAHKLTLKYLIHTHGHLDHVSATAAIQRETGAPVLIHEADGMLLDHLSAQGMMFGIAAPEPPAVDQYIREGDRISFGQYTLSVIETPGHSPGGICLKLEDEGLLFAGDTLFQGSIGRTDLWGASYEQLMDSIRDQLMPLDDETIVHPGHGPSTTLGREKRENPFLQGL